MGTKVIVNPKTGKMETVSDWAYGAVSPESVARTRKQLRDMLSGNTPFHEDEFAEKKVVDTEEEDEDTSGFYGGFP